MQQVIKSTQGEFNKKDFNEFCEMVQECQPRRHYIYYNWYLDIRAGGPTGYLANLLYGLNSLQEEQNPPIYFAVTPKPPKVLEKPSQSIKARIINILRKNRALNFLYVNYFSRYYKREYQNYLRILDEMMNQWPNKEVFNQIPLENTRTIHVHNVEKVLKIKNQFIGSNENRIKIILTCHVPESVASEFMQEKLDEGYSLQKAKKIYDGWSKIEREAYRQCDILIAPSEESLDPARACIQNFNEIVENKDIRYVATGAKAITLKLTKVEAKEKYGVSGKTVIGYMGRHNAIKGYDLLEEAAKAILEKNQDVVFLIGGKQGTEFKKLNNPRWIECGQVDPAEFLAAIDIFVLPNRRTYYDLVLLEVMSVGIPVLASHTGGNISVQKLNSDLQTYETMAEMMVKLQKLIDSPDKRQKIGDSLKRTYNEFFTLEHFARRYQDTIHQIYDDYNLWEEV